MLNDVRERAADYLSGLWDAASGGFRFSAGQPATLMATSYVVLGLECTRGLSRFHPQKIKAVAAFLRSGLRADGSFRDPLFREEDILNHGHDAVYFEEETTAFCLQALDVLDPSSQFPGGTPLSQMGVNDTVRYLDGLPWKDPWLESNRVMFLLSQFCLHARRAPEKGFLERVDAVLDWLNDRQDSRTGLWHGRGGASPAYAMAAAVHFSFFYSYRGRPIRLADRIAESCLALQGPHGLFSGRPIGHSCLDYDALALLGSAWGLAPDLRTRLAASMRRSANALKSLQNQDGGFAHCKFRTHSVPGTAIPVPFLKTRMSGNYENALKFLSCPNSSSNAFSTWFRLLALGYAEEPGRFALCPRRLPFLGYCRES